ncbi:MAG TPA: hypothetical protein VH641_20510 [Streptosporangiaceae bacterium]|jgi:hypothetical protein
MTAPSTSTQIDNILNDRPADPGAAAAPLPGSAPEPGNPLASRHGPFEGASMSMAAIGGYSREVDEAAAKVGVPIPGEAAKLVRDASQIIARQPETARQAILAAERIAADDRIAAEGKRRLLAETADQAHKSLSEARDQIDHHIALAEAELTVAAMPTLTKGNELLARTDAEMMLAGVPAGQLGTQMMELARGDDLDVAALVAGPWGRKRLAASGLKGQDLEQAHKAVTGAAVAAAAASSDEGRRAAARHLATLATLRGQRDAIGSLARITASSMRQRHGLPDPNPRYPVLPPRRG